MTKRPRGFDESWNPRPETKRLIANVAEIIEINSEILPLTLRQIFYMLVSGYGYDKTERAYKRLCETMNRARRARMIGMDAIRDDKLTRENPHCWHSEASLLSVFRSYADSFRLHRQEGQPQFLIVWCEAGGMVPQLKTYCEDYGVPVISSGGFDSVTTKHNLAREFSNYDHVEILHIGDHDPSGVHMCMNLTEDLGAFMNSYGGSLEVTRLAVTPEQVALLDLPTAPPKKTDNRSFSGLTTQAEAIPPRKLREIVTDAIGWRTDLAAYEEVLDREKDIRESLSEKLGDLY